MTMYPTEPKTCVITVHYGDPEVTKRCLNSLARLTVQPYVVVSNNDSAQCADIIRDHIQALGDSIRAEVIQNRENRGFAAGCNTGVRRAQELDADYVWLLNNDAEAEASSLEALLACAAKTPKAIIGSTVVEMDRPGIIQVAGGVQYNPWTTVIKPAHIGRRRDEIDTLPELPIHYIFGASMFIPTRLFHDIGLMDEAYFLYYEELDLCTRAARHDWHLTWCKQSIVIHQGGASTCSPDTKQRQSNVSAFHESRSTMLFTRKQHPNTVMIATLVRLFGKALKLATRKEWDLFPPTFQGLLSGLKTEIS